MRDADELLEYDFPVTPFGPCLLARSRRGVCALRFFDAQPAAVLGALWREWPGARLQRARLGQLLDEVLADPAAARPPLDLRGTEFQRRVWRCLLELRPGQTTSYQALAGRLGRPGAARAVGNAVGRNPVGLLVPCHRVIRSDGSPGGYRWGATRKQALLDWELRQRH